MTEKKETQAATIRFPVDVMTGLRIVSNASGLSVNSLVVSGAEKVIESFATANPAVAAQYTVNLDSALSLRASFSSSPTDLAPRGLSKWTSTEETDDGVE